MEQKSRPIFIYVGYFIVGVILTAVAIYLTPLRHINVISNRVDFIKPQEFYNDFKASPDKYVLIDIRPEFLRFDYPENAINASIFRLSEEWKTLPKGKTLVIFCEENISESVAYGYLKHQGFRNIIAIDGGRKAWKEAGLPLVKNPNYSKEAAPFLAPFEEGGLLPKSR